MDSLHDVDVDLIAGRPPLSTPFSPWLDAVGDCVPVVRSTFFVFVPSTALRSSCLKRLDGCPCCGVLSSPGLRMGPLFTKSKAKAKRQPTNPRSQTTERLNARNARSPDMTVKHNHTDNKSERHNAERLTPNASKGCSKHKASSFICGR